MKRFRVLLSPDMFDLDEPVEVVVNGETFHADVVARDPRVLLERAARDLDRSRLFAAQLEIEVP